MRHWSFQLLDSEDRPLRDLDGVSGGHCEVVAQSPLGGSGQLTINGDRGVDWLSHRVRATFHVTSTVPATPARVIPAKWPTVWPDVWPSPVTIAATSPVVDEAWDVGVFLFTSPTEAHTDGPLTYEVGLLTKMNIVAEDTISERLTLPVGEPVIERVVALIRSTGETRIAVTPSTSTLTTAMTWEAGTPLLTVINDLLQVVGYWSLWCDGSGQFRVEPYQNPADRPVAFEFVHGETSVHFPDWDREQDHSSVPNRFVAVGQGDDETIPLVGIATNENPASPYSFQARGRWITATDTNVDAETQEVIDQYAARKLRDLMAPVSRLKVAHKMLDLEPNQVVSFTPEDGIRRLATIQRMSIDFAWDTDIRAEWREVL